MAAVLACATAGVTLPASTAWAQQGTLSSRARSAEDPAGQREEIERFIDTQMERLTGNDPVAVGEARNQLSLQALAPDASVAFRDFYADQLARRLERTFDGKPDFVRLNAGIVTERVARGTRSQRLVPVVIRLLDDASPGVVLWGMKATAPLLATSLDNPDKARNNRLVPGVVQAVRRFPNHGALAEEAYTALSMNISDPANLPNQQALQFGVPVVRQAVLELMRLRVGGYDESEGGGFTAPPDPLAEQGGLVFLTHPLVWPRLGEEGQLDTVRLLRQLAARLTQIGPDTDGVQREQMFSLLRRSGSGFVAIANYLGGSGEAQRLRESAEAVARIPTRTSTDELNRVAGELDAAIVAAFPQVRNNDATADAPTPPANPPAPGRTPRRR